ncbi:MAG: metallophosphoesterase, partial [Clostridia bacterium]|nr:metallophosphoesterase [Clostridia bacterium]
MRLLYEIHSFFRRSLIRTGLMFENALYDITGGKAAKHCFDKALRPEFTGSRIRILRSDDYSTDIAKTDAAGNITDDDFAILSTSDFHLEDDYGINNKTLGFFIRQIADARPDLVIVTGDAVQTKYQQIDIIRFSRLMEKTGVYWTIVFGNHEVREEKGIYKWMMAKSVSLFPHCLCKTGPVNLYGYANHTINIFGSDNKLRQTLFFFDSGRDIRDSYRAEYGIPADLQGYDFLKKEQIAFYEDEILRLESR